MLIKKPPRAARSLGTLPYPAMQAQETEVHRWAQVARTLIPAPHGNAVRDAAYGEVPEPALFLRPDHPIVQMSISTCRRVIGVLSSMP